MADLIILPILILMVIKDLPADIRTQLLEKLDHRQFLDSLQIQSAYIHNNMPSLYWKSLTELRYHIRKQQERIEDFRVFVVNITTENIAEIEGDLFDPHIVCAWYSRELEGVDFRIIGGIETPLDSTNRCFAPPEIMFIYSLSESAPTFSF